MEMIFSRACRTFIQPLNHILKSKISKLIYSFQVTLNGSKSHDPDGYSKNLSFTWYCKDTVLESRDILSISNMTIIDVASFVTARVSEILK